MPDFNPFSNLSIIINDGCRMCKKSQENSLKLKGLKV
jgi:hypothetical protein